MPAINAAAIILAAGRPLSAEARTCPFKGVEGEFSDVTRSQTGTGGGSLRLVN